MTVIWDERLITRARAADSCGDWGLKVDYADEGLVFLRCWKCDGNVMLLPSAGTMINVDGIITATLGHKVKCHGFNLSGASNDE